MTSQHSLPKARSEGLVIQELPDEVLVYDLDRHRSHCLNRAAALVWRCSDGRTTVGDMAALMQRELGVTADEEAVWLALERLGKAHLLQERPILPNFVVSASRRALVRKLAAVGGLALVTSIVAPEAHAAGTPCMVGGQCAGTACCCICTQGSNPNRGCQASAEVCDDICPGNGNFTCVD